MLRWVAPMSLALFVLPGAPARADMVAALRQCLFEAVTVELQRPTTPGTLSPSCSGEAAREVWDQLTPFGTLTEEAGIGTLKFGTSSFCLRQGAAEATGYTCTLGLDLDEVIRRRALESCAASGC